tara:strand:+ start:22671 stop:23990 length:1320 start_codon:yes stop_codon:yes gene_type:complete
MLKTRAFKASFMVLILSLTLLVPQFSGNVTAQEGEAAEDPLADAGLTLVALRNDTLDTNQDGDIDAIRVVVVMATEDFVNLELRLFGEHKDRQVVETQIMSFSGQSNASLTYDSWAYGEHELELAIIDEAGEEITSIELPTYVLTPALKTPRIMLALNAPEKIETGDQCTINRVFDDETGPRYGAEGIRTFSGAPFTVLDSQDVLDCSRWPAGDYTLRETYRNDLSQTTEDWLNLTIYNRPAPAFSLTTNGNGNSTDTDCSITMTPDSSSIDFTPFVKIWRIQGVIIENSNTSIYDCSILPAGVHLISLEVINNELIHTIHAVNIIRLPGLNLTAEEAEVLPSRSFGDDTPTESVGWISIGILCFVIALLAFIFLVRVKDEDEVLQMRDLGPKPMILPDGSPDPEGLPTTVDDEGVLWRQHPDGNHDWWDEDLRIWNRW